jgi:hypothetical protein
MAESRSAPFRLDQVPLASLLISAAELEARNDSKTLAAIGSPEDARDDRDTMFHQIAQSRLRRLLAVANYREKELLMIADKSANLWQIQYRTKQGEINETADENLGNVVLSAVSIGHGMRLSSDQLTVSAPQGYRAARATHGIYYGAWMFECTVHSPEDIPPALEQIHEQVDLGVVAFSPHWRIGWGLSEMVVLSGAGSDCRSWGLRDLDGTVVHDSYRLDGSAVYVSAEGKEVPFPDSVPEVDTVLGSQRRATLPRDASHNLFAAGDVVSCVALLPRSFPGPTPPPEDETTFSRSSTDDDASILRTQAQLGVGPPGGFERPEARARRAARRPAKREPASSMPAVLIWLVNGKYAAHALLSGNSALPTTERLYPVVSAFGFAAATVNFGPQNTPRNSRLEGIPGLDLLYSERDRAEGYGRFNQEEYRAAFKFYDEALAAAQDVLLRNPPPHMNPVNLASPASGAAPGCVIEATPLRPVSELWAEREDIQLTQRIRDHGSANPADVAFIDGIVGTVVEWAVQLAFMENTDLLTHVKRPTIVPKVGSKRERPRSAK